MRATGSDPSILTVRGSCLLILTLELLQAETAAELDAMLPSILDRAFKGELL